MSAFNEAPQCDRCNEMPGLCSCALTTDGCIATVGSQYSTGPALNQIRCTIAADVLDHLIKMGEPANRNDEIIREMARNNVNAAIEAASTSTIHYETEGMAHLRQTLTGLGFDAYEISTFKSALIALERAGFVMNRKVKAS